ncbi:MAG: cytochrome d ubiquinol oxidase subunit II [Candidatus Riflebacteria bacterium]|nr:cytochrome d ubiquinol oxidase subunit II [Candidatus Riflebacteria bacterium]
MLEKIWFLLWGILWAVYFILDGYDLGIGVLMPILGCNEQDKRVIYNAIGPFWDGNEVWLITAGGVTFAAFPEAYAVMFSSLYTPLILLLCCLMIRGVSIEFRKRIDTHIWKGCWDFIFSASSFCVTILLGIFFGNLFKGVPIDREGILQGDIFTLLNPYALVCGFLFIILFLLHGSLWLAVKSEGELYDRSVKFAGKMAGMQVLCVLVFLGLSYFQTPLFENFKKRPPFFLEVFLLGIGLALTPYFISRREIWKAWGSSALSIIGTTLFGISGMYPALLPSSLGGEFSKTIYNSAASQLTLQIMLGVTLVVIPIVVVYQAWVHKEFSFKVDDKELAKESSY